MKNIYWFLFIGFFIVGCGDDEDEHMHENEDTEFEYHAHINSPNADTKLIGDTLQIEVLYESHTGNTIHNVAVELYNESSKDVVLDYHEHVHATEGEYVYKASLVLNESNNVFPHNDYVFKATVWAMEEGVAEVSDSLQFHVHMN